MQTAFEVISREAKVTVSHNGKHRFGCICWIPSGVPYFHLPQRRSISVVRTKVQEKMATNQLIVKLAFLWRHCGNQTAKTHPTLFSLNVSNFIGTPCCFSTYLAVRFCGSTFDHISAHRQKESVPTGLSTPGGTRILVSLLWLHSPSAVFQRPLPLSFRLSSLPAVSRIPPWCRHRCFESPSSHRATEWYTFRSSDGPHPWAGPGSRSPSTGVSLSAV